MTYVFDTSGFVALFKSYYRTAFPSLWERFDTMIEDGLIISTREVKREIEDQDDLLDDWAATNIHLFPSPTADEAIFVGSIYKVTHFQANIEQKKLLKGGKNADPFVIAKAATLSASVITLEADKPKAAKIPNICQHFGIPCLNLEEFMKEEGWVF